MVILRVLGIVLGVIGFLALLLVASLAAWLIGQSAKHAYFLSESPILADLDTAPLARAEIKCSGNTNRNQSLAMTRRLQDRFAIDQLEADLVSSLREQKFKGPTEREGTRMMARHIMIGELTIAKIHTYSVTWTTSDASRITQLWGCVTVFHTD
jgi:hypothetical protein